MCPIINYFHVVNRFNTWRCISVCRGVVLWLSRLSQFCQAPNMIYRYLQLCLPLFNLNIFLVQIASDIVCNENLTSEPDSVPNFKRNWHLKQPNHTKINQDRNIQVLGFFGLDSRRRLASKLKSNNFNFDYSSRISIFYSWAPLFQISGVGYPEMT